MESSIDLSQWDSAGIEPVITPVFFASRFCKITGESGGPKVNGILYLKLTVYGICQLSAAGALWLHET